jgi:hypothetical protein
MTNLFTKRKKLTFLLFLFLFSNKINAALTPGDIIVTSFNAEPLGNAIYTSFDFTIKLLVNIPAGEPAITFTDHGWVASAFTINNVADGYLKWTPTLTYVAGTIIKVKITTGNGGTGTFTSNNANFTAQSTVSSGWSHPAITSSGGDQVLIFQGTVAAPTFIFGFTSEASQAQIPTPGQWQATGGPKGATNSELPPGLTNGTTAVANTNNADLPIANTRNASNGWSLDNMLYTGPIGANKAAMLATIGILTNWNGSETVACAGEIFSVATGNWSNTSTWVCGRVPTAIDVVKIYNHIVTLNTNCFAKNVTYMSTGTLKFDAGGNLQINFP